MSRSEPAVAALVISCSRADVRARSGQGWTPDLEPHRRSRIPACGKSSELNFSVDWTYTAPSAESRRTMSYRPSPLRIGIRTGARQPQTRNAHPPAGGRLGGPTILEKTWRLPLRDRQPRVERAPLVNHS